MFGGRNWFDRGWRSMHGIAGLFLLMFEGAQSIPAPLSL
ncbi:hypothetical protein LC55x_4635 [Lysobacter capsici]|nr:hypothetical protein LC55x_4635 [Lysobacter capsici]